MKGPEHFGIGVASAGLLLWGTSVGSAPLSVASAVTGAVVAGIGALVPDIDHPRAMIGNRLPAASLTVGVMVLALPFAFRAAAAGGGMFAGVMNAPLQLFAAWTKWGVLLIVAGVTLLGVSAVVTKAVGHRGPTHSLLAAGIAALASIAICMAFGFSPLYGLLFGLGWLTHLMTDAPSPKGLPYLWWPFLAADAEIRPKAFALIAIPVALLGLGGWYAVAQAVLPTPSTAASTLNVAPSGTNSESDVALALVQLKKADSGVAAALTNPDSPVIERNGARTSYTWEYLRQAAPNQVVVKKITVTLDESGEIVGVQEP